MKFTNRSIEALKLKGFRYIVWKDGGEGLGLRVSPKGKKTFIYMYRYDGRARMMTLGDYPRISLADAHLKHREAGKLLDKGIDPGTRHVANRKAEREAETVKELVEEYMEKWAKPRKRTWKNDYLILQKDILPAWGRRKAKDITRRDVVILLDSVVERGASVQANRTLAVIRKMFNFAAGRDIVQYSPCAGISRPSSENRRDRLLPEKEIRFFWHNLAEADMHKATCVALKLILVTAQRPGEITSTCWQDIDLENGWWTIPVEKSKNKMPHRVALSPLALELLKEAKKYAGKSRYVFPSPHHEKDWHINRDALSQAIYRNRKQLGFADNDEQKDKEKRIIPHDLRRTAASHMTSMGIPRLVVSKILNHKENSITAVYDRHSYDQEKRHALEAWGAKLAEIVVGEEEPQRKVVKLRG